MTKANKLKIAGAIAGGLLVGSIVLGIRKKSRDKASVKFFGELERELQPASSGIIMSNAFDIYYWQHARKKAGTSILQLKEDPAKAFAKKIYSAWSWIGDDEDKVYGVFRALKDKVQVSQVAYWYYKLYDINLIDDIRARMSTAEVGKIMTVVKPLNNYRLA